MDSNTRLAQDTNTILRRIFVNTNTAVPADVGSVVATAASGATVVVTLPVPEACIGRFVVVRPAGQGTVKVAFGPRDTAPTTITQPAAFYCDGMGYVYLNPPASGGGGS